MSPNSTNKLLVTGIGLVLIVGTVDAAIGGEWDLFALFAIALVLDLALVFRLESRRPSIPIRRDLVTWLERRAAISGEPLTAVTDRAIATFEEQYGVPGMMAEEPQQ